ncbi:MAG: penicillin-binding protein [Granulosicoccus sp.]|nr:penicillin-binding protein [Granulosicoccus sp.]
MTALDEQALTALKTAFCYMPKTNDVNEFDHPGRVQQIIEDIETVREVLLINGVDPDEVADEIHPDQANNSSY